MSTTKDTPLPPSYDAATGSEYKFNYNGSVLIGATDAGPSSSPAKVQPAPAQPMSQKPGYPYDGGYHQFQSQTMDMNAQPPVPVYRYQHPITGHIITSCLPPDHPEMICLQQGHVTETRYGLLGE